MAKKPAKPCRHPGCPNTTHEIYCEDHEGGKNRLKDPCREKGCPNLIPPGEAYCPEHAPRENSHRRGYTRLWRKVRARKLARNTCCEVSGEFAECVDHIKPLRCGGSFYKNENLQSLTTSVHSIKTAWEKTIGDDRLAAMEPSDIARKFKEFWEKGRGHKISAGREM